MEAFLLLLALLVPGLPIASILAQEHWENRKAQKPFRVAYEVHNGPFVK